jgi:hypothetical protein
VFSDVVTVDKGVFARPRGHLGEVHNAEGVLRRNRVKSEKDLLSRQLVNRAALRIGGPPYGGPSKGL